MYLSVRSSLTRTFVFRAVCRSLSNGAKMYKFSCAIRNKFRALITGDRQSICILGWERVKEREALFVYHARKGLLLHKIPLKYSNYRRPTGFVALSDSHAVVLDAEKGNIFDVRNRLFLRSVLRWTGQATLDAKHGLSAPNR